jgi:hypothetical protein
VITHIVIFKFADPSNRDEAKTRLEALPAQIPQIRSLMVGLDSLGTEVSHDAVLITTHADVDELKAYQAHPVHQEFGAWLRPLLTSRVVVDYEDE